MCFNVSLCVSHFAPIAITSSKPASEICELFNIAVIVDMQSVPASFVSLYAILIHVAICGFIAARYGKL